MNTPKAGLLHSLRGLVGQLGDVRDKNDVVCQLLEDLYAATSSHMLKGLGSLPLCLSTTSCVFFIYLFFF